MSPLLRSMPSSSSYSSLLIITAIVLITMVTIPFKKKINIISNPHAPLHPPCAFHHAGMIYPELAKWLSSIAACQKAVKHVLQRHSAWPSAWHGPCGIILWNILLITFQTKFKHLVSSSSSSHCEFLPTAENLVCDLNLKIQSIGGSRVIPSHHSIMYRCEFSLKSTRFSYRPTVRLVHVGGDDDKTGSLWT